MGYFKVEKQAEVVKWHIWQTDTTERSVADASWLAAEEALTRLPSQKDWGSSPAMGRHSCYSQNRDS